MRKTWLVAATTYVRRVRSGTFLALTLGMPLLMIVASAIPILTETRGALRPIAFVDETGRLATVEDVAVGDETLRVTVYEEQEAAAGALRSGDVSGYLVVPADYFEGGRPTFHAESSPNARLEEGMTALMRRALVPDAPTWLLDRLERPSRITYVAQETGERVQHGAPLVIRVVTPAFVALIFVLSVFTSANQMGSAVVREKEQRSMEMVVTSISPRQLVAGKVVGMALMSVTQLGIWLVGALVGIGLLLRGTVRLQELSIPWSAVAWGVTLGVPAYLLYAVIGAGLGVIAGDKQQARQLSGLLGFLGMGPLYFLGAVIENLDGPLGVGLTLFPLTGPTIAMVRMAMSEVPTWQLGASLGLTVVCLVASIWFVARIFRATMLLYGQALRPREILRALRQA